MGQIYGKNYYIDIDNMIEICKTNKQIKDDEEENGVEINIFKYEILKHCVEKILNTYEEVDDEMPLIMENQYDLSFVLALNTLIKYEVLIEIDDE
jgi:hypothetical protein